MIRFAPMFGMSDETYAKVMTANLRLMKKLAGSEHDARWRASERRLDFDFDVLVIGSGFGGSVTALRLTEKGYRVGVLEAGARFDDQDFADTSFDVQRFLFRPEVGCYGIQRIDALKDCLILSGAGVGGGSLVYANTLYEPLPAFYNDPQWKRHHRLAQRARAVLRPGQADARRGREPAAHAGRRRDGEGRRRHGRRRDLPPDPGRGLLRRARRPSRGSRWPTPTSAAPAPPATPASAAASA